MQRENFLTVVVASITVIITIFAFIQIWNVRTSAKVDELLGDLKATKSDILRVGFKQEIERFANANAINFMYCDDEAINDFYNSTFKEPLVESMIEKLVEERTGGIKTGKAAALALESELKGTTLKEYISTIKLPETTLSERLSRYIVYSLENGNVGYGFESLSIKLGKVQKFENNLESMKAEFGISFSEEIIEAKKKEIKNELVKELIQELEKVRDNVLVSGDYLVVNENDEEYKLIYNHPISEHLKYLGKVRVYIICIINKAKIKDLYKSRFVRSARDREEIPIRIFGKVIKPLNTSTDNWELELIPFAIY